MDFLISGAVGKFLLQLLYDAFGGFKGSFSCSFYLQDIPAKLSN